MFALMFALARMASAAWVGAAVLFVIVAIDQTEYIKKGDLILETEPAAVSDAGVPPDSAVSVEAAVVPVMPKALPIAPEVRTRLIAQFAKRRFEFYYVTGAILIGTAWFSTLFLRRRYLKASRWRIVMFFLTAAATLMAYDWREVYGQLKTRNEEILRNPQVAEDGGFMTLHEHSKMVNSAQLLLTFLGSLFLCLPGTRPEQPVVFMKQQD